MSKQRVYVATASGDGTVHRFLLRIGVQEMSALLRFSVAPAVWQALMWETNYGTIPGTRFGEMFELCTPGGYRQVIAEQQEEWSGLAILSCETVRLDFKSVL